LFDDEALWNFREPLFANSTQEESSVRTIRLVNL
jgi:hypothetical protein